MIYIKILSIIALIGSIAWLIFVPGFDAALAVIGSISAIISAFVVEGKISKKEKASKSIQQHQSVSKSSTGIQAGGDVNIGENRKDNHARK
jgi:hypothetical protein